MKLLKFSVLAMALASFPLMAVAGHKDTKECKACCKSGDKCDACCKDKGKECLKDCCKMSLTENRRR